MDASRLQFLAEQDVEREKGSGLHIYFTKSEVEPSIFALSLRIISSPAPGKGSLQRVSFCVFGAGLPERLDRLLGLSTPNTLPRQFDSVHLVARLTGDEQEGGGVQDDKVFDRVRGRQLVVEQVEQRERVFERSAAGDGREWSWVQAKDGRVDGSFGDRPVFQIPDLGRAGGGGGGQYLGTLR